MGADIYTWVEQRILTPNATDQRFRTLERKMAAGGPDDLIRFEAAHVITWKWVQLLEYVLSEQHHEYHNINHQPSITEWDEHRNYGLFGVIGGVRDRGGKHLDGHHRGMPEGFFDPEAVQDLHSVTWYMCQELTDLRERMPSEYGRTTDVIQFEDMNRDLVHMFGAENVRITMGWDC